MDNQHEDMLFHLFEFVSASGQYMTGMGVFIARLILVLGFAYIPMSIAYKSGRAEKSFLLLLLFLGVIAGFQIPPENLSRAITNLPSLLKFILVVGGSLTLYRAIQIIAYYIEPILKENEALEFKFKNALIFLFILNCIYLIFISIGGNHA